MEGVEGVSKPPVAEVRKASVNAPVLEKTTPTNSDAEDIAESLSPRERGDRSTTDAIVFLDGKREENFFEGNPDLSTSVDSVFEHMTKSEDGTRRTLDSDGLRNLASTLSRIEDPEAALKLGELKQGMIVRVEGVGELAYDEWQDKLNQATSEERAVLEKAQFGYPETAETVTVPADTAEGGESTEMPPDKKFLSETITALEQKMNEKKATGEDFALEQRLLTFASIAQEVNGRWGSLARESAIRELNRNGYSSSAELTAQMPEQSAQNQIEILKLCQEKGLSLDKAREVWTSVSERGFLEFINTMHSLGSINEVFGRELKNEDYEKMFGKVLSKDELSQLLEKNDKNHWAFLFLLLSLSIGYEAGAKVVKGGR